MSRAYEMYIDMKGFARSRRDAIKHAADANWGFEWFTNADDLLAGCGSNHLCGGESEQEFSHRLARAIWRANGGYCYVLITATYLENLPFETYEFDEDAFQRMLNAPSGGPP